MVRLGLRFREQPAQICWKDKRSEAQGLEFHTWTDTWSADKWHIFCTFAVKMRYYSANLKRSYSAHCFQYNGRMVSLLFVIKSNLAAFKWERRKVASKSPGYDDKYRESNVTACGSQCLFAKTDGALGFKRKSNSEVVLVELVFDWFKLLLLDEITRKNTLNRELLSLVCPIWSIVPQTSPVGGRALHLCSNHCTPVVLPTRPNMETFNSVATTVSVSPPGTRRAKDARCTGPARARAPVSAFHILTGNNSQSESQFWCKLQQSGTAGFWMSCVAAVAPAVGCVKQPGSGRKGQKRGRRAKL